MLDHVGLEGKNYARSRDFFTGRVFLTNNLI